jgi:hypothetical protein
MSISVAVALASKQENGGVLGACVALDFASVSAAPADEFVGLYDDLFSRLTSLLSLFDGGFDLAEPLIICWELGVDGLPSRPILFTKPSDCNFNNGQNSLLS